MTQTGRQRGDDKWVWEEERREMCHKVFTVAVTCVCGQLSLIFLLQLSSVCLYNTPFPFSVLCRFPAHCLIVLHLFAPFLNYFNLFKISFHFSFSPYLTAFALNSSPLACLEKLSTETTSLRRIKHASTPFANSKHCAGLLMSATFRSPALPVVLSPPFIFPSLLRTSTPLLLSSFSCVVEEIILQMMPVARFIVLEKVRVSQERKCT